MADKIDEMKNELDEALKGIKPSLSPKDKMPIWKRILTWPFRHFFITFLLFIFFGCLYLLIKSVKAIMMITYFPFFYSSLKELGWDKWQIYAAMVPFFFFLILVAKLYKNNKQYAMITFGVFFFCHAVFMHYMDSNSFFTGAGLAKKCYYLHKITGECEVVACTQQYEREFNQPILPLTAEMSLQCRQGGISEFKAKPVYPECDSRFFTYDGKPLYYYYQWPDSGKIELFLHAGTHPQTNVALKPVDEKIVMEYCQQLQKAKMSAAPVQKKKEQLTTQPESENPTKEKNIEEKSEGADLPGLKDARDNLNDFYKKE